MHYWKCIGLFIYFSIYKQIHLDYVENGPCLDTTATLEDHAMLAQHGRHVAHCPRLAGGGSTCQRPAQGEAEGRHEASGNIETFITILKIQIHTFW